MLRCAAVVLATLIALPQTSCSATSPTAANSARPPTRIPVWARVAGSPAGFAISGSGPRDLWILTGDSEVNAYKSTWTSTEGRLFHGDGATWSQLPSPPSASDLPPTAPLLALWVAGPHDVTVANADAEGGGDFGIYRWNGSSWSTWNVDDNRHVTSFWGSGPNDIWGVGGSYLGHWDGTTWTHVDSVHFPPIAGASPADFWLEGGMLEGGAIDGRLGLEHHSPPATFDSLVDLSTLGCESCSLNAAWAAAQDDIWFVGDAVLHFDGARWKAVPMPVTTVWRGVSGSSQADVWAVGDGGAIVHFDGSAWTAVVSPTTHALQAVWASGSSDAWAIGDAVYHATF